jgi:hypothetical protein
MTERSFIFFRRVKSTDSLRPRDTENEFAQHVPLLQQSGELGQLLSLQWHLGYRYQQWFTEHVIGRTLFEIARGAKHTSVAGIGEATTMAVKRAEIMIMKRIFAAVFEKSARS